MQKLSRHSALLALVAAGLLWGLTVPLSKLVLEWLDGGTLTVVRFAIAAPLLAFAARKHLRAAFTPRILLAGAVGYGIVIVLQNAGISHTSVSHASLIVGAMPALVALMAVAQRPRQLRPGRAGSASRSRSPASASSPAAAGAARASAATRSCSCRSRSRRPSWSSSPRCSPGATRSRSPPCR